MRPERSCRALHPRVCRIAASFSRRIVQLFDGRNSSSSRTMRQALLVVVRHKMRHAEVSLCVIAPPSSSLVTSSWVTVLITSGPVMNM